MACKTVKQICAGGVVVLDTRESEETSPQTSPELGNLRILLVKVERQEGRCEWLLPKGHLEEGETLEVGAIREIAEETGLSDLEQLCYLTYDSYIFTDRRDRTVEKDVHYYLFRGANPNVQLTPNRDEGIVEVLWAAPEEALVLTPYDNVRRVVREALDLYDTFHSK